MRPLATGAAAAALAALLAAPAARPAADGTRVTGTRGSVLEISADGGRVAIRASLDGKQRDCHYASVWTPSTGAATRFSVNSCFPSGRNDDRHLGLTLAGTRLVWVNYEYGNRAYCEGPFTATLARPRPVNLGIECDPASGAADHYFDFAGDGGLLAFSAYRECLANCLDDNGELLPDGAYDVDVFRMAGGGAIRILAPRNLRRLLDANGGRILVLEPENELVVYSARGTVLWREEGAGDVDTAALAGDLVVTRRGRKLTTYSIGGGETQTRALAAGATGLDADRGIAVYRAGGSIHLVRLRDGRDRVLRAVKGLVEAEIEPPGLFYAHNVPRGGSKPGRVTFVPFRHVAARLASPQAVGAAQR